MKLLARQPFFLEISSRFEFSEAKSRLFQIFYEILYLHKEIYG